MNRGHVLVVGATGTVGYELLLQLRSHEFPCSAMLRRSNAELPEGVRPVYADLTCPSSLRTALQGVDLVFLLSGDSPDQVKQECAVIDAAKMCGVRGIVKSSAFAAGLDPPLAYGANHAHVEQYLKNSGLEWAILRPTMFMQNFLELSAAISQRGLLPLPFGNAKVSLIDARDVALAASTLFRQNGPWQRTYEINGPEAINMEAAAHELSKTTGRSVRYLSPPFWVIALIMQAQGIRRWDIRMRKQLFTMIRSGGESNCSSDFQELTGQMPGSFAEFTQRYFRTCR
ncbi:MAG: NmrA family NAD(P)-binding protein [Pseudomonadota bacterium]